MTARTVETEKDRDYLIRFLRTRRMPFTITVQSGKRRTVQQNSLQFLWINEAAEQLGDRTAEELRGYCKLTLGVPILRAENEAFREKYDAVVKPLNYEQKIALMMEPLDMPVTRLMTTDQKTRYLDAMQRHFAEQGVVLTMPVAA